MTKPKLFTARPARGQALLDYNRRIKRGMSMPLYCPEVMEKVRPNGQGKINGYTAGNFLLQSDCLPVCAWMNANNIAADLVYIDPPFASGADYAKTLLLRGGGELNRANAASLGEEVLYGDIWQKEDYLNWIYERLLAIREVMSENASIYVHLDWHIGPYVKVLLDEVFGEDNFLNTVSWRRQTARGMKTHAKFMPHSADYLYLYAKNSENTVWNGIEKVNRFPLKDAEKKFKRDKGGFFSTSARGAYTDESIIALNEEGRIYVTDGGKLVTHKDGSVSATAGTIRVKNYKEAIGNEVIERTVVDNIWDDIPGMGVVSHEYLGYPTQKPEGLLRRVIEASSNEGELVVDFFSGSGTTAKVAHDLGRRFIACDIGLHGVQTSRDRLLKAGARFDALKIKTGLRLFRNPEQTEKLLLSHIPGWEAETDKFWDGRIGDEQGNYMPVKIVGIKHKLTMQVIGAVLTAAGETGANTVVVIYANKAENVSQSEVVKAAKKHRHSDCSIRLMSVDKLLRGKAGQLFGEDSAEFGVAKKGKGCRVAIRSFHSPYLKRKIDDHNAQLQARGKKITIAKAGLALIESVQFDLKGGDAWQSEPSLEDNPGPKKPVKGEYEVPAASFRIKIRSIAGDETTYACDGKTIAQCDER